MAIIVSSFIARVFICLIGAASLFALGAIPLAHADFIDAVLSPNPSVDEILGEVPTREEQMLQAINATKLPDIDSLLKQSKESSMSITPSPKYPGPNQDVTISLSAYNLDLGISSISWYINGTLVDRGPGLRDFSFRTGDFGSISSVKALITTPDGKTYEKSLVVYPTSVELAWEALTYTPPFYKGKALASPGSIVKVVAIPHLVASNGREIASENLGYTWSRNDIVDQRSSGLGKFVYYADGPSLYVNAPIKVKVYSTDGVLVAESTIKIKPAQPKVLFYEESPLAGIEYGRALAGTVESSGDEVTVRAEPYFFSVENLSFRWFVDGAPLPTATSTTITLGESGVVRASFGNLSRNIQTAAADISVRLSNNLFGGF